MAFYILFASRLPRERGAKPIITNAAAQNNVPAIKVNDAPSRSQISPAMPLANSIATPLTRLKKP